MVRTVARRRALAALAATPLAGLLTAAAAPTATAGGGIPPGYQGVDPRTARRVPLWHELSPSNPIFPGDPEFTFEIFTTIPESGYLLEQITNLGTHTGTHISAPAHFVEGGRFLDEIGEFFALMPLAVLDVKQRVKQQGGDFSLGVADLKAFERAHGRFPSGGCVLVYTGFSSVYFTPEAIARAKAKAAADAGAGAHAGHQHKRIKDYFDPAPGLTAEAVAWLFDQRGVVAVGSDTFGPDASSDVDFGATSTALAKGGITLENAGTGLGRMRPYGDWISINGARPHFSGFQTGVTGFTR